MTCFLYTVFIVSLLAPVMTVYQHAFQTCLHLGEVLVQEYSMEKAEKPSDEGEEGVQK